jgi:hypothetical protein
MVRTRLARLSQIFWSSMESSRFIYADFWVSSRNCCSRLLLASTRWLR